MENQGSFTPSRKSTDSSLLIMIGIGGVLVIILALILNYLNFFPLSENYPRAFGWLPHQTSSGKNQDSKTGTIACINNSPLFKFQTATIEGTIANIDGNTVLIEDESGQSDSFPLSDAVVIYSENPSGATNVSRDRKSIKTGIQAIIVLETKGDHYEVKGITY